MRKIVVTDVTLRDGQHAIGQGFMPDQVGRIAADLDSAGVDMIEVAHGFGLGASSLEFGIAKSTDCDRLDRGCAKPSTVRELSEMINRSCRSAR